MAEAQVPWYRNPAFLHTLDTALSWLAGIASLGAGPAWLQTVGKAAAVVLVDRKIAEGAQAQPPADSSMGGAA